MTIGIMGAKGSFSEEAARTYLVKEGKTAELEYLVSAERVLTALEEGSISFLLKIAMAES